MLPDLCVWLTGLISQGLPTPMEKNGDFVLWFPKHHRKTYRSSSESALEVSLEVGFLFFCFLRKHYALRPLLTFLPAPGLQAGSEFPKHQNQMKPLYRRQVRGKGK